MRHTLIQRDQQAASKHIPDPNCSDALTVSDGTATAGTIVERDGSYFAFDAAGTLIGEFKTRAQAMRAVPSVRVVTAERNIMSVALWARVAGLADDGLSIAAARRLIADGDGPGTVQVRRFKRSDTSELRR